jgi:hexosaminidase
MMPAISRSLAMIGLLCSCLAVAAPDPDSLGLVPRPAALTQAEGQFKLPTTLTLDALAFPAETPALTQALAADGQKVEVWKVGKKPATIRLVKQDGLPAEGYRLTVTATGIEIAASEATGAFYGIQTLRQLLQGQISLPCLTINDQPRFGWRGFMLDSSRHFQTPDEIRRWLDWMAMHKLNVFHWHLVDGHGWRLEIKKYPKLASVAAWREQPPIGRYGGFYTQDDVKAIVAYATARHITVVPEIEMPGHSKAVVAAYPELLACDPKQEGETDFFFDFPCPAQRFPSARGSDVMCAGKESTFTFLEDVLDETMALFPSTYIHVGGDEVNPQWWLKCPDCQRTIKENKLAGWPQLQSRLMQRVEKHLAAHQRKLIGWDEIIEGGLSPTAAVTSWRGISGGVHAAKTGHDAVMSPGKPLYLDHGQSDSPSQPAHWPGKETLKEIYEYEPIPAELTADEARHILGLQGNLWSCFTHTDELLQIQGWPRLCAVAETGWSPRERPPFANFQARMTRHEQRLTAAGINFWRERPSFQLATWKPDPALKGAGTTWEFPLDNQVVKTGTWSVNFKYQKGADALFIDEVSVLVDGKVVATDRHRGITGAEDHSNTYQLAIPKFKSDAKLALRTKVLVEPWARGGNGDSTGVIRMSEVGNTTVITYAPEMPLPKLRSTTPAVKKGDKGKDDWKARHQQVLDLLKTAKPEIVVIGASITQFWGGEPKTATARSPETWAQAFGDRAINLGFAGDRTENLLWRIEHGELDGIAPKIVIVQTGNNNLALDTEAEVVAGVDAVCRAIHAKLPDARILLLGLLPRQDQAKMKADLDKVNYQLETTLHPRPYIDVLDLGNHFRKPDGTINLDLFSDGLHPNAQGYAILAEALKAQLPKR